MYKFNYTCKFMGKKTSLETNNKRGLLHPGVEKGYERISDKKQGELNKTLANQYWFELPSYRASRKFKKDLRKMILHSPKIFSVRISKEGFYMNGKRFPDLECNADTPRQTYQSKDDLLWLMARVGYVKKVIVTPYMTLFLDNKGNAAFSMNWERP